jgi:hypothetical protein
VDDGYPSDRILLHEVILVLTFANDTRLMRNVPCPDMGTPSDTSSRAKLSYNKYQFPFSPNTCAYESGDLFVVRPCASWAQLAGSAYLVVHVETRHLQEEPMSLHQYHFLSYSSSIPGCTTEPGDLLCGVSIASPMGLLCPVGPSCSVTSFSASCLSGLCAWPGKQSGRCSLCT